jgi:SAM-dependent MidA family methyltransferase
VINFPPPSTEETARSERLSTLVRSEIDAGRGFVSFARFMELALYAPQLGYYTAGHFDADFTTAPELTPLFGRTLARQVAQILGGTNGDVLEFGAGSGRLALDVLNELDALGALPRRYSIVDISPALMARQRKLMGTMPTLCSRIEWLHELPERFEGVIVANEVLDAMPAHIIAWREDGIYERGVAIEDDRFVWREKKLDEGALFDTARQIEVPVDYVSEISLTRQAFVATLGKILERGVALLTDYGFPAREYYHPQRSAGTLMCHYRNLAHDDPFLLPGLQDITSHVDFSAVARAASSAGLDLLGYNTQANFLIDCGITDLLAQTPAENAAEYLPLSKAVQKLLSPSEMGELFKVIALGRGIDSRLIGFRTGDKSHLL